MSRGMICLAAMLALCVLLGSGVRPAPAAAAPVEPQDTGVYEEDFSAYTYKDHTENAVWDIWAQELRLEPLGSTLQSKPAIARDGSSNIVVVWLDYRSGRYAVYAQKLDGGGNRLWADDVRVNSGSRTVEPSAVPAVAVDGDGRAVVVWEDYRNGTLDIYAQMLSANGNRLWEADMRVSSDSGRAFQSAPAVAVDGSGGTFVVWHDCRNYHGDIYAQRLDENGSKLWVADVRVNFDSGTASREQPDVAVDGSGNAVVVWEDYRNPSCDVYAQRLDTSGNRLWAADVRINFTSGTTYRKDPAVVVDGRGNAAVVWQDHRNGNFDIYAQELNGTGNRLWATDVRVNSDNRTAYRWTPVVAVDGSGNLTVAWKDNRNDYGDIYAQKLDANGNRLWIADARVNSDSGTAYQVHPAVTVDGSGNVTAVWEDNRNSQGDIYAQKLNGSGNRLWAVDVRVNSDSGTVSQEHPAVAVDGSGNAIVVWSDYRNGDYDIYAQKLDGNGSKLWASDVRVNSDTRPVSQVYPAVTVDGNGNAIVVWEDHRNDDGTIIPGRSDIYAQKLDRSGNKLWMADVCINSYSGTAYLRSPAVAVDGSGNAFAVWYRYYSGIYAQKLDASGNKLWMADVCVYSQGGEIPYSAAVAVDRSGDAIVVWYGEGVYAQKLDGGGRRLWTTDVRVSSDSESSSQYVPAVAVDGGGNAVVVWEDYRRFSYDIYAQKLDAGGNRLWAADVPVSSDSGTALQEHPAVAVHESGDTVIVWEDYRNSSYDIYAQMLDESGNRLWPADERINSDSGAASQWSPAVAMDESGNAVVLWGDDRNGNTDVYAQRLNTVGGKGWLADLQIVYPDRFYFPTGTAQSCTVDTTSSLITQALLTADYQANGGAVQFYLTNDGGTHWFPATPDVTHAFTTTGSDLRWRAVLSMDPIWYRTPVVNSLRIEYSTQASYSLYLPLVLR